MLKSFDFTVAMFAYYKEVIEEDGEEITTYKIMHHKSFFEHLFQKRLVIENDSLNFPISTFERMIRYSKYGYYPCRESKIKLINSIREQKNDESISESLYEGMD